MVILAEGFQEIINEEKHNIPSSTHWSYGEITVYKSLDKLAVLPPALTLFPVGPVMLYR